MNPIFYDVSRFSELDIYLFKEGTHTKLYEKLGAHQMQRYDKKGTYFALWAPNANSVSIRADFNDYSNSSHPMKLREDGSGIWEAFVENVALGVTYRYHILGDGDGATADKSDPYAFMQKLLQLQLLGYGI